ncbi:portal_HK97, phage portal protein, HK97 family [uncultured Caudovirales phage]|uniref:Portal_HK97, phage portal protein, HK97 family n=1 Tax=uncultured Caudovirales phage TaxID=2100421 RepID=A0A6J5LC68_9CAUD|nr:portal_HK97, phage portal protein, HK97 family [uncultured Caudovirales phage]
MGVLATVKSFFTNGVEGSYRGPANGIGEFGGSFQIPFGDGFQRNLSMDRFSASNVPAVYASVMAFARAVSQCYPKHKVINKNGQHEASTTSPASRLFRNPNSYQTFNQFIFNVVAQMLFDGECVCLIARDDRFAPKSLTIISRGNFSPYVDPETNEIFYSVGMNPMDPESIQFMAPARDIIHFRSHTPRHPLIGESPIKAAALAIGINVALSKTQAFFFNNMNRPSGILSTDKDLTKEQMTRLREVFAEQSKAWATGGMPILSSGLSFNQLSVDSVDAQLIESQRMSIEDIARVFGVPLPIIGDLSKATMNNTEQLISMWLSISLGSLLENIERSFDTAFGFGPDEYTELDVSALLRTDFLGRVDGLTKGVMGGLYTPNEARAVEGLHPVANGDKPYMQQQMVELGYKPPEPKPAPAPTPAPAAKKNDTEPLIEKSFDEDVARALVFEMMNKKVA